MKQHAAPGRRRIVTAITASITAVAIVACLALITAASTTSSLASTNSVANAGPAGDRALDIGPSGATPTASGAPSDVPSTPSAPPIAGSGSLADVKNVVLILADDMDWALFDRIPRLTALQAQGMTFTNHTVTDSLCCPSRTSILRSQYVHNHHVVSNSVDTGGGWPTFKKLGEERDCLPVWLQSAGVTTALFGKYLNDYTVKYSDGRVPPGWNQWAVSMSGADSYRGYDYTLNENGTLHTYGHRPQDFLNDILTAKATQFITTAPDHFFLELASFNPHRPAPVALKNKGTHLDEAAPRLPNYNAYGTNEPSWMRKVRVMGPRLRSEMDALWRQRAQSAESVADSVSAVQAALVASGRASDTMIIITADNGFHAGAHRMRGGKRTAFREDTVVPMIVIGPGVTPGSQFTDMTSTIDLAPTIDAVLGAQTPTWADGRSLQTILTDGAAPADWRTAVLSESMGRSTPGDPDYQADAPPNFSALRTPQWLYVVYRTGERELYNLAVDPYELNNIVTSADPGLVSALNSQLQALRACAGATCRTADALPIPSTIPTS